VSSRLRVAAARVPTVFRLAAPAMFAVAAMIGMGWTIGSLIANPAPTLGYYRFVNTDALALFYGHGLYHDPAGPGYLATVYPPVMPLLIALLDLVHLWDGWGVAINVLATAALAYLAGLIGYRAAGRRGPAALATAAGLGGMGVWLATIAFGVVYVPWVDPLSWGLALTGMVLLVRADRSHWMMAASIVLLTAGTWTKQTTIVAPAAAVAWLAFMTWRRRRPLRFSLGFVAALLVANGAAFAAAQLLSDGWASFYTITVPARHVFVYGAGTLLRDLFQACGIPLLVAGVAIAAGWPYRWRPRRDAPWSTTAELGILLSAFVVIALPVSMYFRQKAGSNQYYYLGVDWGLALIAALAVGRAQRRSRGRVLADTALAAAAAFALIATFDRHQRFDLHSQHVTFASVPPGLQMIAGHESLYDPVYSDLAAGSTHRVYSPVDNVVALLAAGVQPRGLIDALLERRFDAVVPFDLALAPLSAYYNAYASGFGRYEDNYLWKLDVVIAAGYAPEAGSQLGVLVRRPGPDLAMALRSCFGPFRLAGAWFDIRHGGGLWCTSGSGGQTVSMRGSPAPISQLISRYGVSPSGFVTITATRPSAGFTLYFASGSATWEIDGNPRPGGWAIGLVRSGRLASSTRVYSGKRLTIDLTPASSGGGLSHAAGGAVDAPLATRARIGQLTIAATTGGDVSFDLNRFEAAP
jgi:hypothetical protein